MRKVLIGFVGLIILAFAAVLIVPGFIDWNTYKNDITNQVASLTGRQLTIDGNIEMTVLPAPAITVNDVSFANAAGADVPHMVRLKSLEVRIALGPLLSGDIQVQKVRIVDPVVLLEILPDGQPNWAVEISTGSSGGTPSATVDLNTGNAPASDDSGSNIQLDNVELVNATIIYRDAKSGIDERIDQLTASFKAASLLGPFESVGNMVVRGIPVSYEVAIDGVFQGRTVPVTALIRSEEANAEAQISGNVFNLSEDPKFTGTMKAKGGSLAALLHAVAGVRDLPGVANQNFSLTSDLNATATAVDLTALEIKLGDTSLMGGVQAELADIMSAHVELSVKHVNVDKIVGLSSFVPTTITSTETTAEVVAEAQEPGPEAGSEAGAETALELPSNVAGSVSLVIEALTYREKKAGPVRLNADLSNSEIIISQFSAQLPGTTELALFGFASVQDGELVFDGESEIAIGNTRGLARWLDADISQIPNGRLRHVRATANIRANQKDIRVSDIKASFDRSNLEGGITLALRKRLAFGASFVLDRIDLDGYLPKADNGDGGGSSTTSVSGTEGTTSDSNTATTSPNDPLAALAALTTFDANVRVKVGEIVHEGVSIKGANIDGSLYKGALTIKNASVKDIAGAQVEASGKISDLGGNPRFEDFNLTFSAKSIAKLAEMMDVDLPVPAKSIGKVASDVTINGTALLPSVAGKVSGLGATASVNGQFSVLPIKPLINADVTLKHGSTIKLLQALGVDYTPSGKVGALDFAGHINGGLAGIEVTNLNFEQGAVRATGSAGINLKGARPVLTATIRTGDIIIDSYLPAGTAPITTQSSSGTSSSGSGTGSGSGSSGAPWPNDPIDLGALNELDAQIQLQSSAMKYDAITVTDAIVNATLAGGVLKIETISGGLFGGAVGITGVLDARNVPTFDTNIKFNNGQVGTLLATLTGEKSATGTISLDNTFAANGRSVAEMVSALDGSGSFAIQKLDVKNSAAGTPLAGFMELFLNFGRIGAGQDVDGLADVSGSFAMNDGVAKIQKFDLLSGFGNGTATGSVDLGRWIMDVNGSVKLTQNLLTALLAKSTGALETLPFSITGPLDNPDVTLETGSLLTGGGDGSLIPGLDKLDEKLPGLGNVLQGILGGGSNEAPAQPSTNDDGLPEPQQQPAPEPQKLKPADLLNQLLQF
ncbi:MAG: AsmA family protein [Rhodospirillales bacterium]|nr:AsmA family protein [Rhodospirillales bacterium]MBT4627520.1 AsmA family protein [Rhodospirillales bacterium]MBT5352922.1 AsmA family protein [Rhodospirillales bacterium]MBT5520204.1 AsmA family protein [Rhodospirillales bacterium]MBT6108593.1 AsmA family protein [Rhodospirillales bacterium]